MSNNNRLQQTIEKALKKMGLKEENRLCRYIPISTGGYIHHFTFQKLKKEQPDFIIEQIDKHILVPSKPSFVKPKSRAPRGSRVKKNQLNFTRHDIEKLLDLARKTGDQELVRRLMPKNLKETRRELITSIKNGKVDVELWNDYVQATASDKLLQESPSSF